MPRYRKGDRVVVRDDLIVDEIYRMDGSPYNTNIVTHPMLNLSGQTVTISEVFSQYYVKEDIDGFRWTDEMFVGLEEEVNAMKALCPIKEDELLDVLGF